MKHIVEQTVVPENPSINSIINKEKYNLYAPVARKGRPGIAAYNADDFEIKGSTVSLNPRIRTVVEEADLKTAYDYVINTPEALASLESLSGRVLVRDVTLTNSVALTVGVNVCLLTLYNVVIPDDAVLNLTGHWYCSINCIGEQRGYIILHGFKGVRDFNPAEGALVLYGCHSISNCTISEAEDCYHIDNCWAISDDPTFYNCHFICGISFADSTERTVEFDFCSYLSNIDCEGRYVECTFVDDTTCKGFVSPEDVGKVRAITADGSYVPVVPAQGGGGGGGENAPTKVSELENDAGYITSEEAPVQSVNGEKGAVTLTAEDVGADETGTAVIKVAEHNVDNESHKDVRLLIAGLAERLNALANSDDTTLDQMKEVVDYIKSNRGLIEQITTNKISYTDIIDNLTTNAAKKPLSAAQGVALKALIDAIVIPTKVSELVNDKGYLTSYTESDPTVPSWAKKPSKPIYTKNEVGLGNVDNVQQYSAENPPPYPVQSVNGKTGEIALNASDVGARPNTWVPTAADVGARPNTWTPTATDVGARPNTWTPTATDVGARPNTWTPTYSEVGADKSGAASEAVSEHNVDDEAHNDIRLELKAIAERINAVLDSDDTTLDELSEIVAYIKSNKSLIELVTSTKVGYGDIVDNLTTNSTKNVLSASQGVILKRLIDTLSTDKLDSSALPTAIDTALAQAKESGEFTGEKGDSVTVASVSESATSGGSNTVTFSDGKTLSIKNGKDGKDGEGQRGKGILKVTSAPASYTTATGGKNPIKRMALSTIKSQADVNEVLVGDSILYTYYLYHIYYLDATYAYMDTYQSIRGAPGTNGKDGTSITITSVNESDESGGSNTVNFSDGKTLTVKNGRDGTDGRDGQDGQDGQDGDTPVKGKDYYTDAEKAEWEEYIATELAKRGQLKPEFAQSLADLEANGNTSLLYVLPDGYIYAFMYKEGTISYTNLAEPTSSDWKSNSRINASGGIASSNESGAFVSNVFECKAGDVLRVKGVTGSTAGQGTSAYFKFFPLLADGANFGNNGGFYLINCPETVENGTRLVEDVVTVVDGVFEYTILQMKDGTQAYKSQNVAKGRVAGIATNGAENVIITINQEIVYTPDGYQWANTGLAFVPADYEPRIITLENKTTQLAEQIEAIEQELDNKADVSQRRVQWCAMGDSITEGYVSYLNDNGEPTSKIDRANGWATKVAELNGWGLTNKAIGGTGYIDLENSDTEGVTAAWYIARNTDFTLFNLVTLAYGVNDWKGNITLGTINDSTETPTTIYGGMKATIEAIIASNPLCKIVVITPLNCAGYDFNFGTEATNWGLSKSFSKNGTLEDIFAAMVNVCEYYGIEYVDMTHKSVINRKNILECLTDGVHPNAETHTLLAYELAKKIPF